MHKLYKGKLENIIPQHIKDNSINLIFTDLPYGTTNCSWDTPVDLDIMWREFKRVLTDNGAILLFAQTPFDKILGASNLDMLRYEWIWEKTQATGHLNAKKMPMKAHENILVFYNKLPTYNYIKTAGHKRKLSSAKNRAACINRRNNTDNIYNNEYPDKVKDYDSTERYPRSVIKFPTDKQKYTYHKAQKPLGLIKYFIKTYSNKGDTVLDACAGSGTTFIGCHELSRISINIEKDKRVIQNSFLRRVKDLNLITEIDLLD